MMQVRVIERDGATCPQAPHQRDPAEDRRAAIAAADHQCATQVTHARVHAGDAEAWGLLARCAHARDRTADPLPVVEDAEQDHRSPDLDPHGDTRRRRVPMHVGKRLLHDAQQRQLNFRHESVDLSWNLRVRRQTGPPGKSIDKTHQRRPQSVPIQIGGFQI